MPRSTAVPERPSSSPRASRALSLAALAAWSCALVAGALALRAWDPSSRSPWLARALRAEAVHVAAHLALYGVLTALATRVTRGPTRWAALVVAATALAQEAAQTLPFARAPGWPELFDLLVDALAASVALALCATIARREAGRR